MNSPHTQVDGSLPLFHRRIAAYLVAGTVLMMVIGIAASVALGLFWTAHMEPTSDAERVLQIQKELPPNPNTD